jgi:hypothetical protein
MSKSEILITARLVSGIAKSVETGNTSVRTRFSHRAAKEMPMQQTDFGGLQRTQLRTGIQASLRVAVVAFPYPGTVTYKFLSDVAFILDAICDSVLIIDGNTDRIIRPSEKITLVDIDISLHAFKDIKPTFYSAIPMLVKTVGVQLKLSLELVRRRHDVDVVLFYTAFLHHLLPLVTAKILKKRAVEVVSEAKEVTLQGKILEKQYPLSFRLLDGVSPLSEALIKVHGLDKYPQKLLPEDFDSSTLFVFDGKASDHQVASGGRKKDSVLLLRNIDRDLRGDAVSVVDFTPSILDLFGVDWRTVGLDEVRLFAL